eukprot:gnl/MRDRNA2_/MRDRNA2_85710_c0_seq1.p1 gnl/MRDRNA2_/MRDRNA2_85710_c0~~gnl/MRDRNA2_/MRDRNA2_85710_c0_seq1.p1  ORF type:complete len:926 (-),score=144.68 gnl/MRDRNA2_/MRDRNA2_85710_c0_seq1:21-2798(-)
MVHEGTPKQMLSLPGQSESVSITSSPSPEGADPIVPREASSKFQSSMTTAILTTSGTQGDISRATTNSSNPYMNAGTIAMDSRDLLKAFRLIGGQDGIDEEELHSALAYQGEVTEKLLKEDIHQYFLAKTDPDGSEYVLGFDEFQEVVNDHTLLQQAIYKFIEKYKGRTLDSRESEVDDTLYLGESRLEIVVLVLILLNALVTALSADVASDWRGWQVLEVCFVIIFIFEICVRVKSRTAKYKNSWRAGVWNYLTTPGDLFDFAVTASAALALIITVAVGTEGSASFNLTLLRLARILKAIKLMKFLHRVKEAKIIVLGLLYGFKTLFSSFIVVMFFLFMFAVHVRGLIADAQDIESVDETNVGTMNDTFPTIPMTCLVVFRCIVMAADDACVDASGEPIFVSFSRHLGLSFSIPWVLIEVILILGVLNLVTAAFVMQSHDNKTKTEKQEALRQKRLDDSLMDKLEFMLRNLLHPKRKGQTLKLRNANHIIDLIQTKHPEVATKIVDFPQQMIAFAEQIPESVTKYERAFNENRIAEADQCKELENLPHSALCTLNGQQSLIITVRDPNNKRGQKSKLKELLGAGRWEDGVLKEKLTQQTTNFDKLMKEAEEVQTYVKKLIHPGSNWAIAPCAGNSGPIWNADMSSGRSGGICDEAIDPGVKGGSRLKEKVMAKYDGHFENAKDYARLGLIYHTVDHLLKGLLALLQGKLASQKDIQVVKVKNSFFEPTPLGWRDVKVLVRVRVPSTGTRHIMELQLQLSSMAQVRVEAHDFYAVIRGLLPPSAVTMIIDGLTVGSTLDLGMREEEWLESLNNRQVQKLLDELEVPRDVRMHIFEVLDADNSGIVTSSQLREGLLNCKAAARSMDLVDCKVTAHDIQTRLQIDVSPKLSKLEAQMDSQMQAQARLENQLQLVMQELQKLSSNKNE